MSYMSERRGMLLLKLNPRTPKPRKNPLKPFKKNLKPVNKKTLKPFEIPRTARIEALSRGLGRPGSREPGRRGWGLEESSKRLPLKGSIRGSLKGSIRGPLKGSIRGSIKGSVRAPLIKRGLGGGVWRIGV